MRKKEMLLCALKCVGKGGKDVPLFWIIVLFGLMACVNVVVGFYLFVCLME